MTLLSFFAHVWSWCCPICPSVGMVDNQDGLCRALEHFTLAGDSIQRKEKNIRPSNIFLSFGMFTVSYNLHSKQPLVFSCGALASFNARYLMHLCSTFARKQPLLNWKKNTFTFQSLTFQFFHKKLCFRHPLTSTLSSSPPLLRHLRLLALGVLTGNRGMAS